MSVLDPSSDEVSVYVGLESHAFGHPKIDVAGGGSLLRIWPTGTGGAYFSLSPDSWDTLVSAVTRARLVAGL